MLLTKARLVRLAAVLVLVSASLMTVAVAPPAAAEQASAIPGPPRAAAARIDAGGNHSCSIDAHGTVSCWGSDAAGQLGNGAALTGNQPSPTTLDTAGSIPDSWTAISAGNFHTCALAVDGTAWCWGVDDDGQLGNGAALTGNQPSPTAVDTAGPIPDTWTAISAGDGSTCALAADGTAWCWGSDEFGQLGNGAALTGNQPSPTAVDTAGPIPDTWTAISAGSGSTCALAADGTAWCWGSDEYSKLGNGAALTDNQPSPSPVDTTGLIPDTWTAISVGLVHTCALAADGTAWCWGSDFVGRLGNGATVTADQPSPSPVDTTGLIPDTWTAISAGGGHTCALASDGTAWCWGPDQYAALGNGTDVTGNQPSPTAVDNAGPIPDTWTAISAGTSHTCALAADGTAWCWGTDASGQLGNGAALAANQPSPSRVGDPPSQAPSCTIVATGPDTVGTAGDDVICGTEGPDRIAGLGGNDTIYGFGGDDQLSGGDGNDTVYGGMGSDSLVGGAGNDQL